MIRLIFTLTILATVASTAQAKCVKKTIFACSTTNGKQVEVCDNGDTLEYSFGKPGKLEKNFKIERTNASTYQWNGMGRYMNYTVELPTGDTVYSIFTGADKIDMKSESGVNVSVKGKNVATVKCNEKKKMTVDIEGIDLKPAE
ncbi:hypothetical protein [Trichlorobacter lovleyi]|uniref:hypothetical protein n=1 Tax=Trichlorobacter lovleyi TaxID=313985 RepID=UPI0023F3CE88|nr:hypothetical protein [Trichlorobacter lovleyi]